MRIELRRAGTSRISERCIPLVARILTPTGYGLNLLEGDELTDVACAKGTIQARMDRAFMQTVPIHWIDATRAETDIVECGGLMEQN